MCPIILCSNVLVSYIYTFPNLSLEDLSGPKIGVGEGSGRIVAQRGGAGVCGGVRIGTGGWCGGRGRTQKVKHRVIGTGVGGYRRGVPTGVVEARA